MQRRQIYLDNNATTRPTDAALHAMVLYLTECYFNPSAATAAFTGADQPSLAASRSMTELLNAEEPSCFTFTSGATESNNWIFSSIPKMRKPGNIVLSTIEHASVSEPAAELEKAGFDVRQASVGSDGIVNLNDLRGVIDSETVLVSIMAANNETGVLQPLAAIGALIRQLSPGVLFHTDATQAVAKIPIDLQQQWAPVDILTFSAHKFGGPKGVGGVYFRPGIEIPPLLLGGGQEQGRRSGTTNTPGLAGLAAAAQEFDTMQAVAILRDGFEKKLNALFPEVVVHGAMSPRLPNTSCFSLPGIVAEDAAAALAANGIIVGTGSACTSGATQPPKTLLAMSVDYDLAQAALRISLSPSNTAEELNEVLSSLSTYLAKTAAEKTSQLLDFPRQRF